MEILEFVREFKVGPFAIFDTVVAYLGVFLLAPLLTKLARKARLRISRVQWLWLVLPVSVVTHLIFGQNTPLTNMIVDPTGFYLTKIVILFMLFMGLRNLITTKK